MGLLSVMKEDVTGFGTIDLVIAVIFGVIARVYMLAGSPLINVVFRGMGPIGIAAAAATFMPINYIILIIPGGIRKNGLTTLVASEAMCLLRYVTGDPFAYITIFAYFWSGLFFWIVMAAFKYQDKFVVWFLACWVYAIGNYGGFVPFWGYIPLFGSAIIGFVWYVFGDPFLSAILNSIVSSRSVRYLGRVETLRMIYRSSR